MLGGTCPFLACAKGHVLRVVGVPEACPFLPLARLREVTLCPQSRPGYRAACTKSSRSPPDMPLPRPRGMDITPICPSLALTKGHVPRFLDARREMSIPGLREGACPEGCRCSRGMSILAPCPPARSNTLSSIPPRLSGSLHQVVAHSAGHALAPAPRNGHNTYMPILGVDQGTCPEVFRCSEGDVHSRPARRGMS